MIAREQLNRLMSVTEVCSAFAQIYCIMEEAPLEELPNELKEDSINLFRSFEELLDQYNNYIQNAIKMSSLPD